MYSIPRDDRFTEGQALLLAIPTDKTLNSSAIASLRFRGPKTDEHGRFDVLQIRKTELGPLPIRFSSSCFSSHGRHLPTWRVGSRMIRRYTQSLDMLVLKEYEIFNR